jgi:hypothetical protein
MLNRACNVKSSSFFFFSHHGTEVVSGGGRMKERFDFIRAAKERHGDRVKRRRYGEIEKRGRDRGSGLVPSAFHKSLVLGYNSALLPSHERRHLKRARHLQISSRRQ